MKEFFKDVTNFVRDMPISIKAVLIVILTVCVCIILRYTIKMCYNKDKAKFAFFPILSMGIIVAITVFLCVA